MHLYPCYLSKMNGNNPRCFQCPVTCPVGTIRLCISEGVWMRSKCKCFSRGWEGGEVVVGVLKLPMHICHAFKWFTNERMWGFVRERATQREREAFSVRGFFCVRESPQHIDGVGNCVCASSLVIKPGDTTEPLVVWRGGGTEKREMMMMMMMINVFLIFFLFVNTFYIWK